MFNPRTLAIALVLLCATIGHAKEPAKADAIQPNVTDGSLQGYKLAWHDEFDGNTLNTDAWVYRTDSKMLSTQKPENVSLQDGKLLLAVKKEKAGKMNYTGAGVISKKTFKYGFYEARFKTPPGSGWHTSFWLMTHDGSGGTSPKATSQELDVIENDSINPLHYGVNVHRWNPQPHKAMGGKSIKTPNLSADFHVFGCEFTPDAIKYYFDGKLVQTVTTLKQPHSDQHIWLTTIATKLGSPKDTPDSKVVDESKLPAAAEFDYVRFFSRE